MATDAAKTAIFGTVQGAKDTFGKASQSSFLIPAIATIVGIVLILIIVYVVIQYRKTSPTANTKGPIDLWKPDSNVLVSRKDTKKSMTGTYTLSFYLRIDAVPEVRTSTPLLVWPGTWTMDYNSAQEQLIWNIAPAPDGSFGQRSVAIPIPSVPLQRWTQITVAVEGRSLDMYVNGRLVKSDQLTNLPTNAAGSITIAPGSCMGQVALVQVWARRLTGPEVAAFYTDTSDSQGRPLLGPGLLNPLKSIPNLFCPSGDCTGSKPSAAPSQTWEFPYA